MPVANKTLNQVDIFTRFFYRLLYGQNPAYWSEEAHKLTGWEFWLQPDGEKIPMWKDRTKIDFENLIDIPYPDSMALNPINKQPYLIPTKDHVFTFSPAIWMGTYDGEPVQTARVENNATVMRTVSYGYPWQQNSYARVPVTADPYVAHCGGPNWANDRHVCIYDPIAGEMHELISYDEKIMDTIFNNQALGWGRWKNGELQEGSAVTAVGRSITATLWDRDSIVDPHILAFVLGDYEGADGTVGFAGPLAGALFYLPKDSKSYIDMVRAGGECRAIAEAANVYGIRLEDRSGYSDSSDPTVPGKTLLKPGIRIQWGAWTRTTNLHHLKIKLHDLRMIVDGG